MARITMPPGTIAPSTGNQTVDDILYGSRVTSQRYEVLNHDPVTGVDTLAGYLDGVEAGGSLQWSWNARIKGSGEITVADLDKARDGYMRIADLDLMLVRIRPVTLIDGLPDFPRGAYIVTAQPDDWDDTGHLYRLELHDKCVAIDEDQIDRTFTADNTKTVLQWVQTVVQSAGETMSIDQSVPDRLANPKAWSVGTSKLTICNDLLEVIGYNSLTCDPQGNIVANKSVLPAKRPIVYDVLDLPRELISGPTSIYAPAWTNDADKYKVPNKIVCVGVGTPDAEPLIGYATNEDPNSEFSYQRRKRWKVRTDDGVEVPDGDDASKVAALTAIARARLIAASSVQATREITHLPVPVWIGDAIRFEHSRSGIDSRHIITSLRDDLSPTGLMKSTLQEVVDL